MLQILPGTIFLALIGTVFGFPKWDGLRITFCRDPSSNPEHCFQPIPRTVRDAVAGGWTEIKTTGGCEHHGRFYGRRFIKGGDVSVTPIYDVKGVIAGIQVNHRKDELASQKISYRYDAIPDFLDDVIRGHAVYTLTYYFIRPDKICSSGRTEAELKVEGTATGLWLQVGQNTHEHNLERVPLYRDVAAKQGWNDKLCVPMMGNHNYYDVGHMQASNCSLNRPSFLLYSNSGNLQAFGTFAVGKLSSSNFESPGIPGVVSGLGEDAPKCLFKYAVEPEMSMIHMYLIDSIKDFKCERFVQEPHSKEFYSSPNARSNKHY